MFLHDILKKGCLKRQPFLLYNIPKYKKFLRFAE